MGENARQGQHKGQSKRVKSWEDIGILSCQILKNDKLLRVESERKDELAL